MTEDQAREILDDAIDPETHALDRVQGQYVDYRAGESTACLDGNFSADALEAIAAWIRAHRG